jgi:hypothetical protein
MVKDSTGEAPFACPDLPLGRGDSDSTNEARAAPAPPGTSASAVIRSWRFLASSGGSPAKRADRIPGAPRNASTSNPESSASANMPDATAAFTA